MLSRAVPLTAVFVTLAATTARAQHDHGPHHHGPVPHHGEAPHHEAPANMISVSLGAIVASYEARLFRGDYQGLVLGATWSRQRFSLTAMLPAYRLTKNGLTVRGLGDAMLHGHAELFRSGSVTAGAAFAVMFPTGSSDDGLGMGHVMLMPSGWAKWDNDAVSFTAAGGFGRGIGDESIHQEHGAWPLVEPMAFSELFGSVHADHALASRLRVGVALAGALPVPADAGTSRLTTGLRATWITDRIDTSLTIDTGLVGDPFELRAVLTVSARK